MVRAPALCNRGLKPRSDPSHHKQATAQVGMLLCYLKPAMPAGIVLAAALGRLGIETFDAPNLLFTEKTRHEPVLKKMFLAHDIFF